MPKVKKGDEVAAAAAALAASLVSTPSTQLSTTPAAGSAPPRPPSALPVQAQPALPKRKRGPAPPPVPRPHFYTGLSLCIPPSAACACCSMRAQPGAEGLACGACRSVLYCSSHCLTSHWVAHMPACFSTLQARVARGDLHKDDTSSLVLAQDYALAAPGGCKAGVVRELVLGEVASALGQLPMALHALSSGATNSDSPCRSHSLRALALLYAQQGRLADMEAPYLQLQAGSPVQAGNLAQVLKALGKGQAAEPVLRAACEGSRARAASAELALLPEASSSSQPAPAPAATPMQVMPTLALTSNLALALCSQARGKEAAALAQAAQAGLAQALGPRHPATLASACNSALALQCSAAWPAALAEYRRLLEDCREVLGELHPSTLHVASELAVCLARLGQHQGSAGSERLAEAVALQRDTVCARLATQGARHPASIRGVKVLCDMEELQQRGLVKSV